jgi:RimJ/RimL family protein N-acetyltransferase
MAVLLGPDYLFRMSIRLSSDRLDLTPFTSEILESMIRGESDTLHTQTGARFSGGIAPPLMEDALPHFLDRLRGSAPPEWWGWLAVDRILGEAIGSVGFAGPPDDDGLVLVGYSVYPRYERMGYGTEAAGILIQWALKQPGITAVRATIPPWNTPSLRVAEKLGMRACGESTDPEVGQVIVFEIKAKA